MLVSPQHFQQADLYHEAHVDARLAAIVPFTWGVSALAFDATALAADQVAIERFEGVFPDGTPIRIEAGTLAAPKRRPIAPHFAATLPSLGVFLGLPKERSRARP